MYLEFLVTKTCSVPAVGALLCSWTPEEIPVANAGFHAQNLDSFQEEMKLFFSGLFVLFPRITKHFLCVCDVWTKDKMPGPLKAWSKIPSQPCSLHLCGAVTTHLEPSKVLCGHIFVKKKKAKAFTDQSTASVLNLMCRYRTGRSCSWCWSQTASPLCFINLLKRYWPSSIAQKGSISKPCPLQLEPDPFVSGQGVCRFCPSAGNPDSRQTEPGCTFTQQIKQVNSGSGPNVAAVWTAALCLCC